MKNDINKNMLDKLKMNIAILNIEEEQDLIKKRNSPKNKINWRIYIMKKKVIAAISMSIILASGVVLANNIENVKKFFGGGLDYGIQTAAENGYIANPNMDYIESNTTVENLGTVLNNVSTKVKITDFMMDDLNLNVEFDFEFDEQIKDIFNLDNLHNINLNDLIIRDEKNRILYAGNDEQAFKEYCNKNNLDYVYGQNNENYLNCGLQSYPSSHDKNNNSVTLTYNMYTDKYPKSKKLYFSFKKITLQDEPNENTVTLEGSWDIKLDVPKNMYTRSTENYKVINCDNKNFDIYTSKVSNTGFEIGLVINNIEKPEYPKEVRKFERELSNKYKDVVNQTKANKEFSEFLKSNPSLLEKYIQFFDKSDPINIGCYKVSSIFKETSIEKDEKYKLSYIENSNGKRFYCSLSPSRKQNANFIDGNRYDFYETFDMTKYNSTDKIKVVLYYYEEPVTIELEKAK